MKATLEQIQSARWRLNNVYSVVSKDRKVVPFRENIVQKAINDSKAPLKMILKARQFGVSTNELLKQLDYAIWTPQARAMIIAHEDDSIQKLFNIVRGAYERLPDALKQPLIGGGSQYSMKFRKLGGSINCDLESRSDTIGWLHVSEAAFVKQERLVATLDAVPLNGRITLESTPNGVGNYFHEQWVDNDSYEKFFFPWFIFPEYQLPVPPDAPPPNEEEAEFIAHAYERHGVLVTPEQLEFRRFKRKSHKDTFFQEYPEDDKGCFLTSGNPAIDPESIRRAERNRKPGREVGEYLTIFEEPSPKKHYVIGADTASGTGSDFCAAPVLCVETMEEVALLHGKMKPPIYAAKLKDLTKYYSRAGRIPMLGVEENNHGHAVLAYLEDHPNLYKRKQGDSYRLGWLTDKVSRPIMVDAYRQAFETGRFIANSKRLIHETSTLVDVDKKIEAASGYHDDCVMGAAIAIQIVIEQKFKASILEDDEAILV